MPRVTRARTRSTTQGQDFRLDDLNDLARFLDSHLENRRQASTAGEAEKLIHVEQQLSDRGRIFCVRCQRRMRMRVMVLRPPPLDVREVEQDIGGFSIPQLEWLISARSMSPCLFQYECVECESRYTALAYVSPDGPRLMVLPEGHGGAATPNTRDAVRYYLDQGERAQTVAAWSAALPMYRSALEHLLFDAGYRTGDLVDKIAALVSDHVAGAGPEWVGTLDEPYMTAVRKLGNAALHTNQGDISKQAEFDEEVLLGVKELFAALLDRVYERPAREKAQLAALQVKVAAFPSPPKRPKRAKN